MTIRAETTLSDQTAQETQGLSPGDLRLLIPDFERSTAIVTVRGR
jgi:hypothetical protein